VTFEAADVKVLVDPQTHLIRRVVADVRRSVEQRGAPDVKQAMLITDYATTTPDAELAQATFDWTPPEGARDASQLQAPAANAGEAGEDAMVGKPAPDFTLKNLADEDVKLSTLKGSVVVLDFWATWCPPCVATMPKLDKLTTELAPKGLKTFAVNLEEDKQTVQKFMTSKKLSLPALLDTDGRVSASYGVQSIPMKFIIGKDGNVAGAFIGADPAKEAAFEKAVNEALAK